MMARSARGVKASRARRLAACLGLALLLGAGAGAAEITLAWDPAPPTMQIGYNVYYGTASHTYTDKVSLGNTNQVTLTGLDPSLTYYFAVSSVVDGWESELSPEMFFSPSQSRPTFQLTGSPSGPATLTATAPSGHLYDILATVDFATWQAIGVAAAAADGSFTFSDPDAAQYSARFYLLHDVTYVSNQPLVQLQAGVNGGILLSLTGLAGHTYQIQATYDLLNWSVIGQVTVGLGGQATLSEPTAPGLVQIYRAVDLTGS